MGFAAGFDEMSVKVTVKGIAPLCDGWMVKSATGQVSSLPRVKR
jgi:hypothetical protein